MIKFNKLAYITLGLFFLVVFYFSFVSPPPLVYFTTDENFISDSGVFMVYGVPIRNSDWPAALSLWIAYLMHISQISFDVVQQFLQGKRSIYDIMTSIDKAAFNYLQHRTVFLRYERVAQLVVIAIVYHYIIQIIHNFKENYLTQELKNSASVVIVSFAGLWIFSGVIRPDAIGAVLFMLVTFKLLMSNTFNKFDCILIAILFSLTISQRLLYLIMAPFVFGALLLIIHRFKLGFSTFIYALLAFVFSFVAFFPYILTDSIMVLKSFLGGIVAKSEGKNAYFLNETVILSTLSNLYNLPLIVLTICGIFYFLKVYNFRLLAYLYVANFLLSFILILQATNVTISHTITLNAIAIFFTVFGVIFVLKMPFWNFKLKAILVLFLSVGAATLELVKFHKIAKMPTNLSHTIHWLNGLESNTKVMVDLLDFNYYLTKTDTCLTREIEKHGTIDFRENKVRTMYHWEKNVKIPLVALTSTFEDERLIIAQNKVLLQYSLPNQPHKLDVYYYYPWANITATADQREKAITDFDAGKYTYFVTSVPVPNHEPYKVFRQEMSAVYYVYRN